MNVNLSISLPEEVFDKMNVFSKSYKSQSQLIETTIQLLITQVK